MKTEFTPGPWIVDEGTDSIENMITCLEEGAGKENEWTAVGIADEDGYAESVAYCHPDNAPLIAAAPEMYGHISLMLRTVFDTLRHGLTDGQRDSLEEMCKEAQAILKRVESREPMLAADVPGSEPEKVKTIFIKEIKVKDPDTKASIEMGIHKDPQSGAIFGIDSSFLDQINDGIPSPFNKGTILVLSEPE